MQKILSMLCFVFFILFSPLTKISFACSFNCGGTFEKDNQYGIKTTSHSGFKTHEFYSKARKHIISGTR